MDNKDFFDLLIRTQERIHDRLGEIEKVQVAQEVNLREHMYRTELNEKAIEKLSESVAPIEKHVNYVEGGLKLVGLISVLVGVYAGIKAVI